MVAYVSNCRYETITAVQDNTLTSGLFSFALPFMPTKDLEKN